MSSRKSVEDMPSASAVEPRMSANSSVHSISAPPWWSVMNLKQEAHKFGFLLEGLLPNSRIIGAPTPENGAAQSLQRGSRGISLKSINEKRTDPI